MSRLSFLVLILTALLIAGPGAQALDEENDHLINAVGTSMGAQNNPGLLVSAWAPASLSDHMDAGDRTQNQHAEQRAFNAPVGQQVTWNNPGDGHSGIIAVLHDGYASNGNYCRAFQQTLILGAERHQGTVQACQQRNGNWQIAR